MGNDPEQVLERWMDELLAGGDPQPLPPATIVALADAGWPAAMLREVLRLASIFAVGKFIAEKQRRQAGEKQLALLKALRTQLVAKAPPQQNSALIEMLLDLGKRSGKKPRKLTYRAHMASFAAAVTVLKKGRTVDAAITEVATPNGISRKELKNFRDRLTRGLTDDATKEVYELALAFFRKMQPGEIKSALSRYVPNPR